MDRELSSLTKQRMIDSGKSLINLGYGQSLFFHLHSSSRGKTLRAKQASGNWGETKQGKRSQFPRAGFRGSTNSRGKIGTAQSLSLTQVQ